MKAPVFTLDLIPTVMAEAKRWFPVALDWSPERGKWTKQPRCKWSDEQNHRKLANVRGYAGFIAGGRFVTVDWDDCVRDGVIDATVLDQVRALNTYAEISLSGTGVHAVAFGGPLPPGRKCEMWDAGHYVVMTGWHIEDTPATVEYRQNELVQLAYDLTPGGITVAEREEYVVPTECFKKERTAEMFKYLRSLKAKGFDKDQARAYLRMFDANRCTPSKIAEAGERWFTDWFNRSWGHRDSANFTHTNDVEFSL